MTIEFMTTYLGQVGSKKNNKVIAINRRTGQPFVRMNDLAKAQEREMVAVFKDDFLIQRMRREWFEGRRIEVVVEIWNKDARKHDLDNQLSTILDALSKAQVIPDDSQMTVAKVTAEYKGIDREDPRAEITVIAK